MTTPDPTAADPHTPGPHAPDLHVLGALALELTAGADVGRTELPQDGAGALATLVAHDLANFEPDAARLQLVTVGAHYDPVELLRPGWPLHQELGELAARAPGGQRPREDHGRIIAFGSHEGRLPGALTPSPDYGGGTFRLVPFLLSGDRVDVVRIGGAFESGLLERGMAGAGTALQAQAAFGLQVEHARYLTVHDLAAMTAMQYEHAGLAPLWPLLETALLEPGGEAWLDALPEPLLRYVDGEARIALFSPRAWHARYAPEAPCDSDACREQLERRYQQFQARQRQFAAVLGAHGVAVNFVDCQDAENARGALA
ncbi:hypothetical protein [Marilutibacter chinensis]|uniref:Uncharacterized protein n=1 Tax=Marilutibacter chinensis TaxID=2912247 RepID=A0ABS9HVF3_9GAMM|nr:hypothetical protein [Lysobacter chinensis]MCF7222865.1 hypothetical protein [Lysobacter chinensis]